MTHTEAKYENLASEFAEIAPDVVAFAKVWAALNVKMDDLKNRYVDTLGIDKGYFERTFNDIIRQVDPEFYEKEFKDGGIILNG